MGEFQFPTNPDPATLGYLQNKGLKPAFSYKDVWGAEHATAFTVAKATQLDVLQSIKGELETAIKNGTTLKQFQKNLTPTLQKLGWWGQQSVMDPKTGKITKAQLGSPHRLKTIYWANTRSARAAGQWERAQRTKRALPYFVYGLGPSKRHRPHHVSLAGTCLPIDHEFWDAHFPPNGWLCKCFVRQISQHEVDRKGYDTDKPPEVKWTEFKNDRTGEVLRVPKGVHPAWASNPGKNRDANTSAFLHRKLIANPPAAAVALRDLQSSVPAAYRKDIKEWVGSAYAGKNDGTYRVLGLIPDSAQAAIAKTGWAVKDPIVIAKPKNTKHLLIHGAEKRNKGTVLTRREAESLPFIGDPIALMHDKADDALILVYPKLPDTDTFVRMVVRADTFNIKQTDKTREKTLANWVASISKLVADDFKANEAKIIWGNID